MRAVHIMFAVQGFGVLNVERIHMSSRICRMSSNVERIHMSSRIRCMMSSNGICRVIRAETHWFCRAILLDRRWVPWIRFLLGVQRCGVCKAWKLSRDVVFRRVCQKPKLEFALHGEGRCISLEMLSSAFRRSYFRCCCPS